MTSLYKQLWYLAQKDETEWASTGITRTTQEWSYFKGLTNAERQMLSDFATEALEIDRRIHGVPAIIKEEAKGLHDPAHYSFGEKSLWVPFAQQFPRGSARGKYSMGYPEGALIHWTAGHRNGLKAGNDYMRQSGMLYLMIDSEGNLSQTNPLNEHGYHGGASMWPGITGNVSDDLIGIELQAGGRLTKRNDKYYTWFNQEIPASEVVYNDRKNNIKAGYYHAYTLEQMETLRKVCCWLHLNNPVFKLGYVLGHDEVAPDRKSDPGGALGMTMPEFRRLLAKDVETIKGHVSN